MRGRLFTVFSAVLLLLRMAVCGLWLLSLGKDAVTASDSTNIGPLLFRSAGSQAECTLATASSVGSTTRQTSDTWSS